MHRLSQERDDQLFIGSHGSLNKRASLEEITCRHAYL
jgi:hypothetical protein